MLFHYSEGANNSGKFHFHQDLLELGETQGSHAGAATTAQSQPALTCCLLTPSSLFELGNLIILATLTCSTLPAGSLYLLEIYRLFLSDMFSTITKLHGFRMAWPCFSMSPAPSGMYVML